FREFNASSDPLADDACRLLCSDHGARYDGIDRQSRATFRDRMCLVYSLGGQWRWVVVHKRRTDVYLAFAVPNEVYSLHVSILQDRWNVGRVPACLPWMCEGCMCSSPPTIVTGARCGPSREPLACARGELRSPLTDRRAGFGRP